MTMKELIAFNEEKKCERAKQHKQKIAIHGLCRGTNEDEWFEIHEKGKSRYKQKIQY
jgi:hypothetical protein